jgi:hypothetical protein
MTKEPDLTAFMDEEFGFTPEGLSPINYGALLFSNAVYNTFKTGIELTEDHVKELSVPIPLLNRVFPLVLSLEDLLCANVRVTHVDTRHAILDLKCCSVSHMTKVVLPLFEPRCTQAGFTLLVRDYSSKRHVYSEDFNEYIFDIRF